MALVTSFQCFSSICCKNPLNSNSSPSGAITATAMNSKMNPAMLSGCNIPFRSRMYSGGGRNAKMGSYIGEGLTFSEAKKTKMESVTVEGADLAKEIAKKVNEDFDQKKLPLMLGMINAIVDDKKLELDWEAFR